MRKNKKLMLGAIAAMGVMAMGVGGVGTFAWFQTTRANVANAGTLSDSKAFNVENPDAATLSDNLYLKISFTYTYSRETLDLTTVDGYSYGITNQNEAFGFAPDKPYALVTVTGIDSYSWHTAKPCTDGNKITAPDARIDNIGETSLNVDAVPGARTRLTKTNPAAEVAEGDKAGVYNESFYAAFNGTLNTRLEDVGVLDVAQGGTVTIHGGSFAFYVSLSGEGEANANDKTKAQVDAGSYTYAGAETVAGWTAAKSTIALEFAE